MKRKNLILFTLILIFSTVIIPANLRLYAKGENIFPNDYPYKSPVLNKFINDSFVETNTQEKPEDFYYFFDSSYSSVIFLCDFDFAKIPDTNIPDFIYWAKDYIKQSKEIPIHEKSSSFNSLNKTDVSPAVKRKIQVMKVVHKLIKTMIPRFSLERGYEFAYVIKYGERQCFLQSILISSIFQSIGLDCGVVMVYKNKIGVESNNGHAVVLVHLEKGMDIVVDASEKDAFDTHQGLFCLTKDGYRYLSPVYDNYEITAFKYASDAREISTEDVMPLDITFLESQFDVYRGEWIKGALHDSKKTKEGLEKALFYFNRSVKTCPQNTLSLYFLARTYEELNEKELAVKYFKEAYELCMQYGWVPGNLYQKVRPK